MFKSILGLVLALCLGVAHAAVDINKATQAELESIKGIGPAMSTKMLDERKKSNFKDWPDVIDRVSGVGPGNAAKFSANGLTVNGAGFSGGAAADSAQGNAKDKLKTVKAGKADSVK
jgi:competence protein ComEA